MYDFAVVKTYTTRIEAEIGKTKLASNKIYLSLINLILCDLIDYQ